MFTIEELNAITYLLNSRETEYPKEPPQITEAFSSIEEKIKKELKEEKIMAVTFSTGKNEELLDIVKSKSQPKKVMEKLSEVHPELKEELMLQGCKLSIYERREAFIWKFSPKILLVPKASGRNYSIEAGLHDGIKNFDHHGQFKNEISLCLNDEIREADNNTTIEISHIDCDTWIGLLKMINRTLVPESIDYKIIDKMDCNGTVSIIKKIKQEYRADDERALFYYLGIGALARKVNFPRVTSEPQDVTGHIKQMLMYSVNEIVSMGKETYEKGEKGYKECLHKWDFLDKSRTKKIGLFFVNKEDCFDPSRPYTDNYNIVVVYRSHWRTVSIYCSSDSQYKFGGRTIEGILFQGHPKACGSPRGVEMLPIHAETVFDFISNNH